MGARRAVLFRENDTPASFATAAAAVWTKNKPAHAHGNDRLEHAATCMEEENLVAVALLASFPHKTTKKTNQKP